jgi:hypothetical protein
VSHVPLTLYLRAPRGSSPLQPRCLPHNAYWLNCAFIMTPRGPLALVGLLALLLVPVSSQPTPAELAAAADAACSGLTDMHIPDPSDRRDIYHVRLFRHAAVSVFASRHTVWHMLHVLSRATRGPPVWPRPL